jgi:hypothetical protein
MMHTRWAVALFGSINNWLDKVNVLIPAEEGPWKMAATASGECA